MKNQRTSLLCLSKRTSFAVSLLALLAAAILTYLLMPTFYSTGTAFAQDDLKPDGIKQMRVTTEMLSRALDLKSVTDLAVFAQNGVTNKGTSKVTGSLLAFRGGNAEPDEAATLKAQKDFSDSFSAINQLPCTEAADADLGGRTFGPGVYCLASAQLAGEMVLDGQENPNAIFIF